MEFYCKRLEVDVDIENCPDCAEYTECKASGYFRKVTVQNKKQAFFDPEAEDSATSLTPERSSKIQEEGKSKDFNWKKWRWEFMRHDPEVQEIYKEILKLRKEGEKLTPENCPYPEIRSAYKEILDLRKAGKEISPDVQNRFTPPVPWCCLFSFNEDGNSGCFCYACSKQGQMEATYCRHYGISFILFPNINKKFEDIPGNPLA